MKPYRSIQLADLIQKELGEIVAKEIEFEPGTLVTLTGILMSKDLHRAKVWVGIIPTQSSAVVLEILEKSRGFLQRALNKRLDLKSVPRIEFEVDRGLERAARLEKLSLEKDT